MKKRYKILIISVLVMMLISSVTMTAFAAGEDLFEVADNIIRDVYTQIAGISTVLAALWSAIALSVQKCLIIQRKVEPKLGLA